MKKVMNLAKAIGVLALLFLSQAMFAQSYVSPQVGLTRVETKLNELLGTIKANQENSGSVVYTEAVLRNDYYQILDVYLTDGTPVYQAVQATSRKMYKGNAGMQKSTLVTLQNEALALLTQ